MELNYIECNYEVTLHFDTLKEIFDYITNYNETHFQNISEFEVTNDEDL